MTDGPPARGSAAGRRRGPSARSATRSTPYVPPKMARWKPPVLVAIAIATVAAETRRGTGDGGPTRARPATTCRRVRDRVRRVRGGRPYHLDRRGAPTHQRTVTHRHRGDHGEHVGGRWHRRQDRLRSCRGVPVCERLEDETTRLDGVSADHVDHTARRALLQPVPPVQLPHRPTTPFPRASRRRSTSATNAWPAAAPAGCGSATGCRRSPGSCSGSSSRWCSGSGGSARCRGVEARPVRDRRHAGRRMRSGAVPRPSNRRRPGRRPGRRLGNTHIVRCAEVPQTSTMKVSHPTPRAARRGSVRIPSRATRSTREHHAQHRRRPATRHGSPPPTARRTRPPAPPRPALGPALRDQISWYVPQRFPQELRIDRRSRRLPLTRTSRTRTSRRRTRHRP